MAVSTTIPQATAVPPTDRHDAARLATAQHKAMLALLRELDEASWDRPTDCTRWTVRDVVAHLVGSLADSARLRTAVRHVVVGRRKYGDLAPLDALNEAQVDDRRGWPPSKLIGDFERLAPKAVRARRRTPGVIRRVQIPTSMAPAGTTVGQLFDVIYIRDMWMHRVDVARSAARPFPTDETDAVVMSQVIRDLALQWTGPAVRLELTGAGTWLLGDGTPETSVRTEAVEYCRLLSGRPAAPTYELAGDESVRVLLDTARVVF